MDLSISGPLNNLGTHFCWETGSSKELSCTNKCVDVERCMFPRPFQTSTELDLLFQRLASSLPLFTWGRLINQQTSCWRREEALLVHTASHLRHSFLIYYNGILLFKHARSPCSVPSVAPRHASRESERATCHRLPVSAIVGAPGGMWQWDSITLKPSTRNHRNVDQQWYRPKFQFKK